MYEQFFDDIPTTLDCNPTNKKRKALLHVMIRVRPNQDFHLIQQNEGVATLGEQIGHVSFGRDDKWQIIIAGIVVSAFKSTVVLFCAFFRVSAFFFFFFFFCA